MKNILFLVFTFLLYQNSFACCAGEPYSLTELLLSDSDPRSIMLVTIDSSWMDANSRYHSSATVNHVFRKIPKTDKIKINSGYSNSSAGGQFLIKGVQYLLVNGTRNGFTYGGFVCDVFSQPIWDESDSSNLKYRLQLRNKSDNLKLIQEHFEKVNSKYTGKINYKLNGQIVATGKMKKGKPVGEWQHFDYHRDHKKTFLRSSATYKKGVLHGVSKNYKRGYGDLVNIIMSYQEMNYADGKLMSHNYFKQDSYGTYFQTHEKTVEHLPEYELHSTTTYYGKDTLREITNRIKIPFPKRIYSAFPIRKIDHGFNQKYTQNGDLLESGHYWWGAKVGEWQYYNEDGTFKERKTYQQPDRPTDIFTTFQTNGMIAIEGRFQNGEPVGEWKSYEGKTIRKTAEYKNGKLDGWVRSYQSDGYVYRRYTYKNGMKDGEAVYFAGKGNIRTKVGHYKNDQQISEWNEFYPKENRPFKAKMYFNNDGHLTGSYQSVYEDGSPNISCTYKNGMYDGLYQKYNQDELLIEQGQYLKNQKVGLWKRYIKRKNAYSICDYGDYDPKHQFGFKVQSNCIYEDVEGNVIKF